ncbi:hypothetical protein Nepgr_030848 [Nepenthes gracilis]|uniref:Uncharacterized protein n=1 Tax=Nepenthes gracilis TaxID=150966 RepID=A0AAD3TG66_NEPGR|nr:hypothetical protein Nepgr_030848 [Nepenthes gracilis]
MLMPSPLGYNVWCKAFPSDSSCWIVPRCCLSRLFAAMSAREAQGFIPFIRDGSFCRDVDGTEAGNSGLQGAFPGSPQISIPPTKLVPPSSLVASAIFEVSKSLPSSSDTRCLDVHNLSSSPPTEGCTSSVPHQASGDAAAGIKSSSPNSSVACPERLRDFDLWAIGFLFGMGLKANFGCDHPVSVWLVLGVEARLAGWFFLLGMYLKADLDCVKCDIEWFMADVEARLVWTADMDCIS